MGNSPPKRRVSERGDLHYDTSWQQLPFSFRFFTCVDLVLPKAGKTELLATLQRTRRKQSKDGGETLLPARSRFCFPPSLTHAHRDDLLGLDRVGECCCLTDPTNDPPNEEEEEEAHKHYTSCTLACISLLLSSKPNRLYFYGTLPRWIPLKTVCNHFIKNTTEFG